MSSTFDGLSLTNSRDIKCNTIFLNYNNDIKNILDIFSLKSDISSITGLPPETLNTLQELANALNNNPDFFNYVNNQLNLKRNISDSYDKTYIDTLINLYYSKSQSDVLLNNKLNLSEIVNYYTKLQSDVLLNNKLNLSEIANYYTKLQSDVLLNNKLNSSDIANYYTKFITDNLLFQKVSYEDLLLYYTKTEMIALLTNKLNANEILNYYTKIDTNNLLLNYYSKIESDANFYSKSYIDSSLSTINSNVALKLNASDLSAYYTQTQTNSNFYNKSYIDSSLTSINSNVALKANTSDLTNYYNKTQVDTQFSSLINSAPEALNTLKELSDALGNDANYASTIQAQISAKRNISDSYTKTDVDSIFNTNKQTINTANITFLDVANLGINTLTIKGGVYTRLINNINQALMDLDNSQISITPPLKLYNNLVVDGSATISNMYNKTQVDALISAGSGSSSNAYTKLETDNLLNVKATTADLNTLSSTVSSGLTARYTKTESNGRYYTKAEVDLINLTPYINIFDGGTFTALNLTHFYGMRFECNDSVLMSMDSVTGIAMQSSLSIDYNLSVAGSLIVGSTDVLTTITDIQTAFNNTYTKTQSDALLNNKQNTLSSSSDITVNKITATTYVAPSLGNHIFNDSAAVARLTLGTSLNTFAQRVIAPAVNANGSILTTSTAESVEIGRHGPGAMVRITGNYATLRLEGIGSSTTATGWMIQRNNSLNSAVVALGTTTYQQWGNALNTFTFPIVATSITASSNLNVSSTTTLNNLTVNGTVTGITKAKIGLTNVDNTTDLDKPVSTATTTALGLKQNTLIGQSGTGEELLTTNYVKRIFGKAPLSVSTFFDGNAQSDPRNNNIQIASNLKWYAGATYISTNTNTSTQYHGAVTVYVRTITETFPTGLFSNIPRIYLNQASGNNTSHSSILRIYAIDVSISSFKIIITDLGSAINYHVDWLAIDENTMGMD